MMIAYHVHTHPTSSEWVTFVHGAGGSSTIWYKQIRFFQKHVNVLLLDLRGHGASAKRRFSENLRRYTFETIAKDVVQVLDHLKINQCHFVGISLGSIVIRQVAELNPTRVKSMILGGAILKMNLRSRLLIRLGNIFKYVLPYLILYRLFAFVIMPKKSHKKSRLLFVREAKKLYQKEFIRWFRMTAELKPLLRFFRQEELQIPTLYVMGEEDYMFLPSVRQVVEKHRQFSSLQVIPNCGHVVNVEQPNIFNNLVMPFIQNHS